MNVLHLTLATQARSVKENVPYISTFLSLLFLRSRFAVLQDDLAEDVRNKKSFILLSWKTDLSLFFFALDFSL